MPRFDEPDDFPTEREPPPQTSIMNVRSLAYAMAVVTAFGCGSTIDFGQPPPPPGSRAGPDAGADTGGADAEFQPTPPAALGAPEWTFLGPKPLVDDIVAMAGTGDDDMWFVGRSGAIHHWDGTHVELRHRGAALTTYYAVWASAKDDVWVAGRGTYPGSAPQELLHWNGANWSSFFSLTGGDKEIIALWGSSKNDVWAALRPGFIAHWDGAAWVLGEPLYKDPLSPELGTVNLNDIWGTAANDVWAVADGNRLLRYDGTSWTTTFPAWGHDDPTTLRGIWGTSTNDVWVSYERKASKRVGLIHWDGSAWAVTYLARIAAGGANTDARRGKTVWGTRSGRVVATLDPGWIVTIEGGVLQRAAVDHRHDYLSFGGTEKLLATGDAGDILVFDPRSETSPWAPFFPAMREDLTKVAVANDGTVFSCDGRRIYHWSRDAWQDFGLNDTPWPGIGEVRGISVVSARAAWAVGTSWQGAWVRRYDETGWQPPDRSNPPLTGIWARSADEAWAIGTTVYRHDAAGWSPVPLVGPPPSELLQVDGNERGDVWVLGIADGVLVTYTWDGAAFRESGRLRQRGELSVSAGLHVREGGDVWVGGKPGFHFDGDTWSVSPANSDLQIGTITSGLAQDELFMIASASARYNVLAYDGNTTHGVPVLIGANQIGTLASSQSEVWAVGRGGATFRYARKASPTPR
jgi:hypothetical protein